MRSVALWLWAPAARTAATIGAAKRSKAQVKQGIAVGQWNNKDIDYEDDENEEDNALPPIAITTKDRYDAGDGLSGSEQDTGGGIGKSGGREAVERGEVSFRKVNSGFKESSG